MGIFNAAFRGATRTIGGGIVGGAAGGAMSGWDQDAVMGGAMAGAVAGGIGGGILSSKANKRNMSFMRPFGAKAAPKFGAIGSGVNRWGNRAMLGLGAGSAGYIGGMVLESNRGSRRIERRRRAMLGSKPY